MEEENINEEEETKEVPSFKEKHLKCSRCASTNCYTLVDGTQICRKCSFREKKEI